MVYQRGFRPSSGHSPAQPGTSRFSPRPFAVRVSRKGDAVQRSGRGGSPAAPAPQPHPQTGPEPPRRIAANISSVPNGAVVQGNRKVGMFGLEAEVIGERFKIWSMLHRDESKILEDPNISLEEYKLGTMGGKVDVTLDNEMKSPPHDLWSERSYTVEFIQKPVDVILGDEDDVFNTSAAWLEALSFWESNLPDGQKLFGMAGAKSDSFTPQEKWKGGQFEAHKGNRNVAETEDSFELHWDGPGFNSYIDAKTKDPKVSIQMTAGSTLVGLEQVYEATRKILETGNPATEEDLGKLKKKAPHDAKSLAVAEAGALAKLVMKYVNDARLQFTKTKRYQKEYIGLMTRTSLDEVFSTMSPMGKKLFTIMVSKYLFGQESFLTKNLKHDPAEKVFVKEAKKEPQALDITIEDLLLSIIKQKRNDLNNALVDDPDAAQGDAFSNAGLAGLSEINANNPEAVEKFHLQRANEMMSGVKGLIFESRSAKVCKLSDMFLMFDHLAEALKEVEKL